MQSIIHLKAGRAVRRDGTNFVDHVAGRGMLIISTTEDGLIQWQWKNRATNEVVEDLLIFPSDTEFTKVAQSLWGRTLMLKFSSSNQKHFYWLQDASPDHDEEILSHINRLLADSSYRPVWTTPPSSNTAGGFSRAAAPFTPLRTGARTAQLPALNRPDAAQIRHLRALLTSVGAHGAPAAAAGVPDVIPSAPELALADVLTPANLAPVFARPELVQTLFPHLPTDLPVPPSAAVLQQIISSAQFQAAVREFDRALSTGMLGDLVRGLGLPESAGASVESFLRAVGEKAEHAGSAPGPGEGDNMETD